jgi:hypothetical protein
MVAVVLHVKPELVGVDCIPHAVPLIGISSAFMQSGQTNALFSGSR